MKKVLYPLITVSILALLPGCNRFGGSNHVRTHMTELKLPELITSVPGKPLPIDSTPRPDLLLISLQKRVLGREHSQREIFRVVSVVEPILMDAVKLPDVKQSIKQLADRNSVSASKMTDEWMLMQEADVLIESGGDPDAISPAGAVGIAQWMPSTGVAVGLKVNIAEAEKLTPQIVEVDRQIAWMEYIKNPKHNKSAPGIPNITPDRADVHLVDLKAQRVDLEAKRAAFDERYDAKKSITAQTRYLLGLSSKFPSPSWLFQAYHGGEGAVNNTLKEWCDTTWPGTATKAIEAGCAEFAGKPLTFETVYFASGPNTHAAAFKYLYGKGDDHRHYWWKVRVAEEAIDLYHRNTSEFAKECNALLPGSPAPMVWYGKEHPGLLDLDDVNACIGNKELKAVVAGPDLTMGDDPDAQGHADLYHHLRPSAWGALALIRDMYSRSGGKEPIHLTEMLRTAALNAIREKRVAAAAPPPVAIAPDKLWPPSSNPVHDQFDYHTIGLEFDIQQPTDSDTRCRLDYAISFFEDRGVVLKMNDPVQKVWHIVPNPTFAKALMDVAKTEKAPPIKGV